MNKFLFRILFLDSLMQGYIKMGVNISDAAAKRIVQILSSEPDKIGLRVSVEGGGCSGFSYKYNLVSETNEDDFVLKKVGRLSLLIHFHFPSWKGLKLILLMIL